MRIIRLILCLSSLFATVVYAQIDSVFVVNTGNWYFANCFQSTVANELGAKTAGQDGGVFNWKGVQSAYGAPCNWTKTDSVVQCLQSHGIDLIPTLICISPSPVGIPSHCDSVYLYNSLNGLTIQSWYPDSMPAWLAFIDSVVERYDMDGVGDMPGLNKSIDKWRIETEWQLYWCSPYSNNVLPTAQQFVQYYNLTANAIKSSHSDYTVVLTGMDSRHNRASFTMVTPLQIQLYAKW